MQDTNRELNIAWLFPNILFLHGERGNILALQRIAGFAGLETKVDKIDYKSDFEPSKYDIIFCPPGEISAMPDVIEWLLPYKEELQKFMESGKVMLATGTGICIFGKRIIREDGTEINGLGLIDCEYTERKYVYGDDICFEISYGDCKEECFGVQVQMVDLKSNEEPFGKLIYGFGNTGKDRNEGIVKYNSIFTNVLGPMLVLNPWLTKEIIKNAAGASGIAIEDFDFDMTLEKKSIACKKPFALSKKTNLTNCK